MSTNNGTRRTKRTATVKRARADRPAAERFRTQARKVSKDVREMGDIATDAAQDKLGQMRDNASEYYEQGRDKMHDVQRTVVQFVREQPVKSILIAAGVGLLCGRLWIRR
jgi:ElaB/YqjD/DUF883 family membrane-anchored ribosome-binding protein